jgi:DNA-binding response OmpR family regulator
MLDHTPYDVMVLDIHMPGMDGIEVMQRACRLSSDLIVIVLTGNATLESAITAVKCGAVDYLIKPASVHDIASVVARALQERADDVQRRHTYGLEDGMSREEERFLCVGPLTLDCERRLVTFNGSQSRVVDLTENESTILAYMLRRPGEIFSCRDLACDALGYDVDLHEAQSIVRPHIFRLRRKLDANVAEPELIQTVRGRGYFFSP